MWNLNCIHSGIMAKTIDDAATQTNAAPAGKLPLIPLVLTVLVAVIGAVGLCAGMAFWLIRSGRLPALSAPTRAEAAVKTAAPATHLVPLDPLLVNLSDPDGHAYLRVSLTLRLLDKPLAKNEKVEAEAPAKGKPVNEFEAAERDAALSVLGQETSASLLASSGKEHLKQSLMAAFAQSIPEIKVQEILLTEFLVQH
jgi:flagellar FliL protein